jgi:hypothetical protein
VKRISTGDENESALLFKLLGTIVEGGQEKVLPHIPEIVSNIANTIMKLLPPVPEPWPQVIEHQFFMCPYFDTLCKQVAFNHLIDYYFHINKITTCLLEITV